MEICCAANLLGITAIIVLLVVVLLQKKKEDYSSSVGDDAITEKTYVFSPDGNNGDQHLYISHGNPNQYGLIGVNVPSWIGGNNDIAVSNVKPKSTYMLGGLYNGVLLLGGMNFTVPRFAGGPNILQELKELITKGPIYLYPLQSST